MECCPTDGRARNRHDPPNSARRRAVPCAISASLVATAGLLPAGSQENLLNSCFSSPEEERLSSPREISVLYGELQAACDEGSVERVEHILSKRVDPNGEILKGKPPLYWAVVRGRLNVVRVLVERYGSNPNYITHAGTTLFHAACSRGHVDIARYLASTHAHQLETPRKDGSTPMMAACFCGRLDIVKFLAEELRCDTGLPVTCSAEGSLLHIACSNAQLEVARYLVNVQKLDPNATKSYGETPMHVACIKGCLDILRFLCEEIRCSIEVRDASGDTPLHVSAQHDKHQLVKYFIERGCETEVRNDMGNTPLMVACLYGKHNTVKALLEAGKADPNCQNKNQESPLQCTRDKEIIKELIRYGANTADFVSNVIEYHRKHIPLGALVRMFIIGHPTAGKSTLAKALQEVTGGVRFFNKRKVTGVSPLTAGIVPMEFESPELGRVLLFDFAGQNEYYASHAALLEASKTSAPLFVLVVNLLETETEIKSRISFWLSFINSHHVPGASLAHMAVIGSHKDKLKELFPSLYKKRIATVEGLAQSVVQEYQSLHMVGFFAVDCRKPTKQVKLRNKLRESCKELRCDSEVDGCCHVLSAFLCDKFAGKITCTVEKVISGIKETDLALPCIPERLCELIEALGERQNILFLRNNANLAQSWVVLEVDTLLTKINGSIFAPASFKEHRFHNNSGTGVLAWSHIQRTFLELELDPHLVVAFLRKLEFCEEVFDPDVLNLIQQGTAGKLRERSRSPTYSLSSDIERDCVKNTARPATTPGRYVALHRSPDNSRGASYPTCPSTGDLSCAEYELSISVPVDERPVFSPSDSPNLAHDSLQIAGMTPQETLKTSSPYSPPDISHIQSLGSASEFAISSLLPPSHLSSQHKSRSNPDFEVTSNHVPVDVRRSRSCNELASKRFFFFPGLLNHERPSEGKIWRTDEYFHFHTGWCVQVSRANQFFTARFLQILLLRISFGFAVAKRCPREGSLSTRQCTVWKNGIRWLDLDGIETVVEMVEQNRAVVVLMRGKGGSELKCVRLRSRLIQLVLNVKRKFCPNLRVTEYLFNPKELENRPYPFSRHSLESFTLYEMSAIVRSVVEVKNWVCGTKGTSSSLCSLADLLYFEPYMNLGEAQLAQVYLEAVTDDQLYQFLFDFSQAHYTRDSELSEILDLRRPSFSSSCGTVHMLCSCCSSQKASLENSNGYRNYNPLPHIGKAWWNLSTVLCLVLSDVSPWRIVATNN